MKPNFEVELSDEVVQFIYELDPKIKSKVAYNIQKAKLIKDDRIFKKLNRTIWEFKTEYGNQEVRLLAFWDITRNSIVIITPDFRGFLENVKKSSEPIDFIGL